MSIINDIICKIVKIRRISEIAKRTDDFEDAGVQCVKNDNIRYNSANLRNIIKLSDSVLQVLTAGFQKCNGSLKNLTLTTANTVP